jgi:hypothetical protein
MRTPTSSFIARFGEQTVLNAHCIDFVYGGVYAWAYLAMAGIPDRDIMVILRTPFDRWHCAEPDIAAVAHGAMCSMGIQRPSNAHICTMP